MTDRGRRGWRWLACSALALWAAPAMADEAAGDPAPAAVLVAPTAAPAAAPLVMSVAAAAQVDPLPPPAPAPVVPAIYGPGDPLAFAPRTAPDPERYDSFGERVGAVGWETAGIAALITAGNIDKLFDNPQKFRFRSEGFFGRDTSTQGVDKLAHAWNAHFISDVLYRRMVRKTGGGSRGDAAAAAFLGLGLQFYGELYDGIARGGGFSYEDVLFNTAGVTFTYLKRTVPGMAEKVDFRLMIVPNDDIYTFRGKRHFEQQWFLLAFKLNGWELTRNTPLRFLEFHVGYHAEDITIPDRLAGIPPKRKPFVGIGINLTELFFKNSVTTGSRLASAGLEYFQIPYTAVHID